MSNPFKEGTTVVALAGEGVRTGLLVEGKEYEVSSVEDSRVIIAGPYADGSVPSSGLHYDNFTLNKAKEKFTMLLAQDAQERKDTPITSGVLDYFPLALAAVAKCSKAGNDQHNPGQPLHWAKGKSTDHADCIARHLIDRKSVDTDGIPHDVKLAWRALALLQTRLESETNAD